MDYLQFVASFEWPIVVGGTLWITRKQLQDMLKRINLTEFEGLGIKATFEKVLDKVDILVPANSIDGAPIPSLIGKPAQPGEAEFRTDEVRSGEPEGRPNDNQIVWLNPNDHATSADSIILLSWRRLEAVMRRISGNQRLGFSITKTARDLKLTEDEVAALGELRKLRNQVAHNTDLPVSHAEAIRYAAAAERLLARITYQEPDPSAPP